MGRMGTSNLYKQMGVEVAPPAVEEVAPPADHVAAVEVAPPAVVLSLITAVGLK